MPPTLALRIEAREGESYLFMAQIKGLLACRFYPSWIPKPNRAPRDGGRQTVGSDGHGATHGGNCTRSDGIRVLFTGHTLSHAKTDDTRTHTRRRRTHAKTDDTLRGRNMAGPGADTLWDGHTNGRQREAQQDHGGFRVQPKKTAWQCKISKFFRTRWRALLKRQRVSRMGWAFFIAHIRLDSWTRRNVP